ncbi:MAG: NAD-dependent succinate-semialdehyde dehydrogenase [Deltaproteobacteria bacterium]|nr:NAD-dependent succinate-semialdehyde dehydrogenase [Deltaproteobacteria bacterium]
MVQESPYQTIDPTTGGRVAEFPFHSADKIAATMRRASRAFQTWRETPPRERVAPLSRLAQLLIEQQSALAALMTLEMGKPVREATAEIEKCAWLCRYYAEHAADFLQPVRVTSDATRSMICYEPLGIVLGIMPWNFPFWQVFRWAVPTLCAGNTVLLKHASNVPQCARMIDALFLKANYPPGTFQSLFPSRALLERMIADCTIRGLSLTGSTAVGKHVAMAAAQTLKKCVFELGGSDPFLVLDDADLAQVVPMAVRARMQNAGQSCIAAKRFLVAETRYQAFLDAYVAAVVTLRVGDPRLPDTDIGPLARGDLVVHLDAQVRGATRAGATVLTGGHRMGTSGFFYAPTVLSDVTETLPIFSEEVFGPVALVTPMTSMAEGIRLANLTPYGLGASIWTRDVTRGEVIARSLEAGAVFINEIVKSDPRLPFGGVKESGYGRELSDIGLHEFTNIKTVWIGA